MKKYFGSPDWVWCRIWCLRSVIATERNFQLRLTFSYCFHFYPGPMWSYLGTGTLFWTKYKDVTFSTLNWTCFNLTYCLCGQSHKHLFQQFVSLHWFLSGLENASFANKVLNINNCKSNNSISKFFSYNLSRVFQTDSRVIFQHTRPLSNSYFFPTIILIRSGI